MLYCNRVICPIKLRFWGRRKRNNMKRKSWERVVSASLAVCMAVAVSPMNAFAFGGGGI